MSDDLDIPTRDRPEAFAEFMREAHENYEKSYARPPGAKLFGPNCNTDRAFQRFQHAVARVRTKGAWDWYLEQVAHLEVELYATNGQDCLDLDTQDDPYCVDWLESENGRRACDALDDVEECFGAVFLAVQRRLDAVASRREHVTKIARNEGIVVPLSQLPRPLDTLPLWHIANYIKHGPSWCELHGPDNKKTAAGVGNLGLIEATGRSRSFWFAASAARIVWKQQGLTCLTHTVVAIVREAAAWSAEAEAAIGRDFAGATTMLEKARRACPQPTW